MLWESEDNKAPVVTQDIVDLAFQIRCPMLPLDHAYALSQAVSAYLPWFADEGGLHLLYGAASGNGWQRPQGEHEMLYLSRRTRLSLRLPQVRVQEAIKHLSGKTLILGPHTLHLEQATLKPLSTSTVLFARHVMMSVTAQNEDAFEQAVITQLRQKNIHCRKLLCGRSTYLHMPEEKWHTRSLMLANLSIEDSLHLQQSGLGLGRAFGCGLFVPHKDIKEVVSTQNDALD
jgi:CRISPR-associated protein Cas6